MKGCVFVAMDFLLLLLLFLLLLLLEEMSSFLEIGEGIREFNLNRMVEMNGCLVVGSCCFSSSYCCCCYYIVE